MGPACSSTSNPPHTILPVPGSPLTFTSHPIFYLIMLKTRVTFIKVAHQFLETFQASPTDLVA